MNTASSYTPPEDILNTLFEVPELAELPLPAAISFIPKTRGWFWLLVIVVGVLLLLSIYHYRRWRRDLWRREAKAQLDQARATLSPERLPGLIRQVLLKHCPRDEVARFAHHSWLETLTTINKRLGLDTERINFISCPGSQLINVAYLPDHGLSTDQMSELFDLVSLWLEALPRV